MRYAALSIVIITAGAACGVSDDGAAKLTWRITKEGAVSTCEAVSAASVRVTSKRKSTGNEYVDVFACKDYAGRTDGLRPGTYTMSVELLDAADKTLSQPFSVDARVTSGDDVPLGDFDFAFGGKTALQATWRIIVNDQPATCADVGAASVHIDSTPTGGGDTRRDTFKCSDGAGTTAELPAGSYNVKFSLVDAGGALLSSADTPATLAAGETKNVGVVEFPFVFHKARFKARMGSTAGDNCSRVVQQEVRISDVAKQSCLAFPLSGARAGMSCAAGECQAESVAQAVEHLGPGQYVMQLLGYVGTNANAPVLCYVSEIVPFTIANDDVDLGTVTAPLDSARDPRCQ